MKSETALAAAQLRYRQWMNDIKECNSRPTGVTVADWCADHQINRETYYYRMKVLRKACLDYSSAQSVEEERPIDESRFVELQPCENQRSEIASVPITIRLGHAFIEVSDTISDDFLKRILEVVSHA